MPPRPEQTCCPVEFAINMIGGKYKALIVWHLHDATLRFSELHKALPRATTKMLTQQLRELERDGLVKRKVYPVIPPKVEYSLTRFGAGVVPILKAMDEWGSHYCDSRKAGKRSAASRIQ